MNSFKLNSLQKFACFVLIVILVIATVGFAANGWQFEKNPFGNNETSKNDPSSGENGGALGDESVSAGPSKDDDALAPEPDKPVYISPATGLEVSEVEYNTVPIAITVDPQAPLYGVSGSDLSFEFPIEDGTSRLLAYTVSEDIMWKIGSLKATRNYISNTANFFGGIVVSYGEDDTVVYDPWDTDIITLDISKYSDCYYAENTLYVYTNEEMINTAKSRIPDTADALGYKDMPYVFSTTEEGFGKNAATNLTIPYSSSNQTTLYYSETTGKYLYYKDAERKVDMLTGENISFTNVFVLFANTTTYESSNASQLVIDTVSGGKGYYVSSGKLMEFNWSTDESGALRFKDLKGETLCVKRGNSYIAYYKASRADSISFY